MFHLFYGKNPFGEITKTNKPGLASWAWRDEMKFPPYMPSVDDLANLIVDSKDRFFVELVYK